jgi:hypothetical protein
MKLSIFSLLLLFALFANAGQSEMSAQKLADLLVSDVVSKCVADLKAQTASYELSAGRPIQNDKTGKNKKAKQISEISYTLISGGDMAVGDASIVITEKFRAQFGFEDMGATIPYVDSCKVKINVME